MIFFLNFVLWINVQIFIQKIKSNEIILSIILYKSWKSRFQVKKPEKLSKNENVRVDRVYFLGVKIN